MGLKEAESAFFWTKPPKNYKLDQGPDPNEDNMHKK